VIVKDILIFVLMTLGMFCFAVSTIGVFRMKDFYCRLHTAGICGTAGMMLFAAALLLYEGLTITGIKIFAILILAMAASPIGTHIICKVAYKESLEAEAEATFADLFDSGEDLFCREEGKEEA